MGTKSRIIRACAAAGKEDVLRLIHIMFGLDGGPGSGNFGHAGRPGKVGGSAPDDGMSRPGMTGPSEEEKELSGMQVRVAQSIAKKAMKHPKVYDDWAVELTADEAQAIQDQFYRTHKPDADGYYTENMSEYYERIWRMLAAKAPEEHYENKPVDGKDMSSDYDWTGVSYTEPKFGQVIDTQIEDIIVRQGFNGVPKVVSKEEFDKIIENDQKAPIMFRTFSAPDPKTLEEYNKGLEEGQWYVDCGIGGSKYGQGMYTAAAFPWNIDDLDSVDDPNLFNREMEGKFVKNPTNGEIYQLRDYQAAYEDTIDTWKEGETAVLRNDAVDFTMVVTRGKDGKFYDRDNPSQSYDAKYLGEHFEFVTEATIHDAKALEERDIERPMGQMRDYVGMNENRILRNSPEGEAYLHKLWELEDKAVPSHGSFALYEDPPEIISIPKAPQSAAETYFKVNKNGETLTREKFDSLSPGIYMATYPGRGLHEGRNRMCLIRVDENGAARAEGPDYNFENRINHIISRGGKIYKCEDVTPVKPGNYTSTRKMTLDPSAKMVTYERLEGIREWYLNSDTQSEAIRHKRALNKIAEREGFSEKQKEAFSAIVLMADQVTYNDELHEMKAWQDAAKEIGDTESVDRLTEDYFEVRGNIRQYNQVKDIGAIAALMGYDAIVCSNYGRTIVVLNRTKLILSDERVEVPREEAS